MNQAKETEESKRQHKTFVKKFKPQVL